MAGVGTKPPAAPSELALVDIVVGAGASNPEDFTNVNGVIFFAATTAAAGRELWKSDGTSAGTVQIKDIFSGATGSSPDELFNVNGRLFFTAGDSAAGTELWTSNGTTAGTVQVKDIRPGATGSVPREFTNVNGRLIFRRRRDYRIRAVAERRHICRHRASSRYSFGIIRFSAARFDQRQRVAFLCGQ